MRGDILRINEIYDVFGGADGVFAVAGLLTLPLTQNPWLGLAVNVDGQVNVFEASHYRGVKKVVFSSSIATYGEPGTGLVAEDAPSNLAPFQPGASLYACIKLIGEALCRLYHAKHGVGALVLRYSTVYGERQRYRGPTPSTSWRITTASCVASGPTVPGGGSEVYDCIHVADVARANVMAMASDVLGEVFNVVSGVAATVRDLIELLLRIAGSKLEPEYTSGSADVRSSTGSQLNLSRAKVETQLGWRSEIDLEEGLRRLIAWRKVAGARHPPQHRRRHPRRARDRRAALRRMVDLPCGGLGHQRAPLRRPHGPRQFPEAPYPIGIVVNMRGERFLDEGADYRNHTYAKYGREIMKQPKRAAVQIFDAKTIGMVRDEYRIRQVTKAEANSIAELAQNLEIDVEGLTRTVEEFNRACQPGNYNPSVLDGKSTKGITPPKSNWALPIDTPPYTGFVVTCGITFTFGGLRINTNGEVLDLVDLPIPGLYAAGELVGGIFYENYLGGAGLMSGAVFGRLAGQSAGQHSRVA